MSGGVDSSVAAALTLERGFQCEGITFKLCPGESAYVSGAKSAASNLGINHHVLDFTGQFEKDVIGHFIKTYEQGATPNPCIECNRRIKFNLPLLDKFDFDLLVTGHYARVSHNNGRYLLSKARDENKDQSYVLYCLTQKQLEKSFFPLGELTKREVRKIAEDKHLASTAESQDICFVPDGDYGNFIVNYTGKTYPEGDIIDLEGKVIGRHHGLIRYTIGQRRGLGVAANIPVYVAAKSIADNTVTLAPESALYSKSLTAKNINLIACADLKKPARLMVKTRYQQEEQPAVAEQIDETTLRIDFDSPQRAITAGQAAVLYDGDLVVGGGTIETLRS
jgi:tRNA-specific 2-thiouridylase